MICLIISCALAADFIDDSMNMLSLVPSKKTEKTEKPKKSVKRPPKGNVQPRLRRRGAFEASSNPVVLSKRPTPRKSLHFYKGDVFQARISQDVVGYEGAVSPVRAILTSGPLKGSFFIGNASLDKKTKAVLVRFDHIRTISNEVLPIEATVHSDSGKLGIDGEFNSNYWQLFWAGVLSSSVSGYSEAITQRNRNVFGQYEIQPNPENAGKQVAAAGADEAARKFSDRAESAPEYTVVRGPMNVQVFVIKTPNEI